MTVKVLFLDDIFSERFRSLLPSDQIVWDDNWVSAIEEALVASEKRTGIIFELFKSGDIDSWRELIEEKRPDILLLDLFWPEESLAKFGNRDRAVDISLDILPRIRESFPSLPVVCFTVKPDKGLFNKVYSSGATFFLEKVSLAASEVQSPLVYIFIYLLRQKQAGKE